jgi:hypothetical protein
LVTPHAIGQLRLGQAGPLSCFRYQLSTDHTQSIA